MIQSLILFPQDADPQTLDAYISDRLGPMLRQSGGVKSVTVSKGDLMSPMGKPPYSRIVTAVYDDLQDVMAFGTAPDTEAVRKEGEELGVLVLMFDTAEV